MCPIRPLLLGRYDRVAGALAVGATPAIAERLEVFETGDVVWYFDTQAALGLTIDTDSS